MKKSSKVIVWISNSYLVLHRLFSKSQSCAWYTESTANIASYLICSRILIIECRKSRKIRNFLSDGHHQCIFSRHLYFSVSCCCGPPSQRILKVNNRQHRSSCYQLCFSGNWPVPYIPWAAHWTNITVAHNHRARYYEDAKRNCKRNKLTLLSNWKFKL